MASKKHYILTSITLGAIAASSALLIGASNMLTKDKIAQNEQNKIHSGIASIFGDSAEILKENNIENDSYKYVNYFYQISNGEKEVGFAYRTTGSNMYGKISLLIGYNLENEFVSLSIITNEQTYASTLKDNYIDLLNKGERELDDVSCGATYGAKLVRDMVKEAKQADLDKVWNK